MKRWIVPILCALAFHWTLYRFDLVSMPPVMAMQENRTVTISLVEMRPASDPIEQVQPLEVDPPSPIKPLAKLTPKPPPVVQPEPQPVPEPLKTEMPPAPAVSEPIVIDDPQVESLETQSPQESALAPAEVQTPGADQAKVRASIPLYHLNPPPSYPAAARRRNYQGIVLLDVLVDPKGRVADVKVAESCGYSMLDRSAVKSVHRWRFEPAYRFGNPIEMWVQVPIKFELR